MTDQDTSPERPLDEVYDTQQDVEQDPYGAWQAIQTLSAALEAERAEAARRKWEDWRQIARASAEAAPDQKERQAYIQGTHAGWNAAIEAAANVADVKPRKGGKPLSSPHHQGVRDGRAVAARLIRNLKKGPSQ